MGAARHSKVTKCHGYGDLALNVVEACWRFVCWRGVFWLGDTTLTRKNDKGGRQNDNAVLSCCQEISHIRNMLSICSEKLTKGKRTAFRLSDEQQYWLYSRKHYLLIYIRQKIVF